MNTSATRPELFESYSTDTLLSDKNAELVYRGRDVKRQRDVVIRVGELPSKPLEVLKNLQALQKTHHPSLAHVYAHGLEEDGLYVVTEYLFGRDLNAYDALLASSLSPVRRIRALAQVFLQVAWALDALHENGLSAGEISPKKIIVNDAGRGRLIVSKILSDAQGSRAYAPVSTDVRELGRLMFRMLCGVEYDPQGEASPSDLQPCLTPEFDEAIEKAAGDDPQKCFVTARELAVALNSALATLDR